jgi:hypothetical protein
MLRLHAFSTKCSSSTKIRHRKCPEYQQQHHEYPEEDVECEYPDTQKKKASCPCPVAGCDNPGACKNDVVGPGITQAKIARIWTAAYYKAKAALELVGGDVDRHDQARNAI